MTFSLIRQLFIVSLCTLILPWTGCQYVREMESLIREQQSQTLQAFVKPLAENLKEHDLFQEMAQQLRNDETPFFAPNTDAPISIDGYRDDWMTFSELPLSAPGTGDGSVPDKGSVRKGMVLSAVTDDSLLLFVTVSDSQVAYYNPQQAALHHNDWLRLVSRSHEFHIFTSAPGSTQSLRYFPQRRERVPFPQIEGNWQEHPGGYQVELKIPRALVADGLRIEAIDSLGQQPRVIARSAGEVSPLLVPSRSLGDWLQRYNHNPWDLQIVNHKGWPLVEQARQDDRTPLQPALVTRDELETLLLNRIYRFFLEAALPVNFAHQWPLHSTQLSGLHQRIPVEELLNDRELTEGVARWYALSKYNQSALLVVEPIIQNGNLSGYVLATQTEKAWLSFTNQALRRVMNLSLLSFAVLVLILLGYAVWLSLRIKRLKQQAEQAILPDGTIVPFRPASTPDELGALSQSYTALLTRVKNYNEYLQSLTHKLAHEIRTPLAIVKSSLEMLPLAKAEEQQTYIDRALSGNQRLANILNAMSESTQVEQLVQHAEFQPLELNPLLLDLVDAYRSTYTGFEFSLTLPEAPCTINGNPELLAQLLDKLVDNARDFTPAGETISLALQRNGSDACQLEVCNPGSRLPEDMTGQLFDSLISVRDKSAATEGTHLGLGLYIVRLITQAHGGQVRAFNLPDEGGVCFQVTLPLARPPAHPQRQN